jgi:polysaccharide biosynthesis protein PslH
MNVLWVGTKPPIPAVDGGRVVALTTLRALAVHGHTTTVVAPVDAAARATATRAAEDAGLAVELVASRPRPWPIAAALGLAGRPLTIARHTHPALAARVARLLARGRFDVVHAEQLQALAACTAATATGVPVVWRAQNVESDLWAARATHGLWRFEARRLARFEGAAVRAAAATVALSARDAARLAALAGGGAAVHHVAPPFPGELASGPAVAGAPAIALPGSAGWAPNEDAVAWFTSRVWPATLARLPGARLHVFGGVAVGDGIVLHPAPDDSATAFPRGAIVVVPLRTAIGVRMRVLEAWARGLPVVATPEAVAGLADDGIGVVLARGVDEIGAAIAALAADPERQRTLVAAGRARLRAHHDPHAIAAALTAIYADATRTVRSSA